MENTDDIYLCVNFNKTRHNCDFVCQKFDSYIEADEYYKKHIPNKMIYASSMIPINKYTPYMFRNRLLRYKINQTWPTKVNMVETMCWTIDQLEDYEYE